MMTVIAIIHVVVCLLLIALVLLQDPKNSGAGGVFGGGGTSSLLGATGAVTFLTRLTRYSAIVFGVTCLVLTLLSRPDSGSVIDTVPAGTTTAPGAPVPQTPENPTQPAAPGQAPSQAPAGNDAAPNAK